MSDIPSDLLILAGAGAMPRFVAEGARRAGVSRVGILGVAGSTPRRTLRLGDWSGTTTFAPSRFRKDIAASGFHHVILAGQISPLSFFRTAFDPEVQALLREMGPHNAHTIFTRVIAEIEKEDARVLPSSLFLGAHIPKAGLLTRTAPTPEQEKDFAFGERIAMAICNLDIGQTVVVKDGVSLAIEGFEGTNSTILRGGRIAKSGALVVKVAKEGHDMRFDIPTIGLRTLRMMRRAHCKGLSVQAGRTLFMDLPAVIREADRLGIAIVARDSGLEPAPTIA